MSKRMSLAGYAMLAAAGLALPAGTAAADSVQPMLLTPAVMRSIAKIDERFLSYNVEMAEVIGGNFWKPNTSANIAALKAQVAAPASQPGSASSAVAGHDPTMFQARPPIDLSNARLRKLAAALAPAYMRTSGTWANSIYFHDSDGPPPATPPDGFQGVLTRPQWKNVIDFSRSVGAKLVTSFAISAGVRDSSGVWTPDQARKFVTYTKDAGGDIAAAEFFNEPNMPVYGGAPTGYDAADYARDFATFRKFAKANAPDMAIVGPGAVGKGVLQPAMLGVATAGFVSTNDMLSAKPPPKYDIFSYHFYGAASVRCQPRRPRCQKRGSRERTPAMIFMSGVYATVMSKNDPSGLQRRRTRPAAAIPWRPHSWTASVTSINWPEWRDRASVPSFTILSLRVNMASSIRTPSRRVRIIGLPYCGAG
jgi:heparanase